MANRYLILLATALAGAAAAAPDLIVVNGDVHTVDGNAPRVEAFAVEDGKFTAVGSNAEIRALADGDTRVIDVHGNTVTPGFVDGHSHVSGNSPDNKTRRHGSWSKSSSAAADQFSR